jgi:hypothetical protein
MDAIGTATEYKQTWQKELERRKRLGLKLPDPVPHPDDIVVDVRRMTVSFNGPMTAAEIPRYRLGAELLAVYEELAAEDREKLATMPEGPDRAALQQNFCQKERLCTTMRPIYGDRRERTKDPFIREVEEILDTQFDIDDLMEEDDEE